MYLESRVVYVLNVDAWMISKVHKLMLIYNTNIYMYVYVCKSYSIYAYVTCTDLILHACNQFWDAWNQPQVICLNSFPQVPDDSPSRVFVEKKDLGIFLMVNSACLQVFIG